MKYTLDEIIDTTKLEKLVRGYYAITGIAHALIDLDGNILSAIGWQDICTKFHRANKDSNSVCKESDRCIKTKISKEQKYNCYTCGNGLVEAYVEIYVKEKPIANLMLGQFFLEPPEIKRFEMQAERFGYDKEKYIEALKKVPIITKEQLEVYIDHYLELANVISNIATERFNEKEYNHEMKSEVEKKNAELKQKNIELENYIQKRKEVSLKLEESEKRYRTLVEALPYGICVRIGEDIVFSNDEAAKTFSMESYKDMVGKKMSEIFYPYEDFKHEFNTRLKKIASKKNTPIQEEKLVNKKTGNIVHVETLTANVKYNEEDGTLVIFRDIAYKKHLEETNRELNKTLEYEKIRTEVFSNISHEFRTPINVILTAIQICEINLQKCNMVDIKSSFDKYLKMIKQNSFRLMKLVNNLLDINKIDSGYMKLTLGKYNIVRVIENIISSVEEYAKNKDIDISFNCDLEEILIQCDVDKIERIMLNLISNAIKFVNDDGKIYIKVEALQDGARIIIEDNGIGIPKENQSTIFDKFIQVDEPLRKQEGSGIGLSIVKSLVEMHGGSVSLDSDTGKGCKFTIQLPSNSYVIDEPAYALEHSCNVESLNIEFSDIYD